MTQRPIAVYYEHPEWFKPLFTELDRRGVAYEKLFAPDHFFDPCQRTSPYSLIVNRVSAFPSGGSHPEIVLYVKEFLAYLESIQANVINGYFPYLVGASKALQISFFERLDLRYPRARIVHHRDQVKAAAKGLSFPVLFKPNIGGSGTGIQQFASPEELAAAVDGNRLDFGIDHTALIQEYLPAWDDEIYRVEILDGELLYAIRLPVVESSFNYCPADGCHVDRFAHCPADGKAKENSGEIESFVPPEEVVGNVRRLMNLCMADLGSVEYLVSKADGEVYYYDINPLSNFVADARRVVGFDPVEKFVDYILDRTA